MGLKRKPHHVKAPFVLVQAIALFSMIVLVMRGCALDGHVAGGGGGKWRYL